MDPEPPPLPHQKCNDQVRLGGVRVGQSLKSLEMLSFLFRVGNGIGGFGLTRENWPQNLSSSGYC